jgi:hypothetical protein
LCAGEGADGAADAVVVRDEGVDDVGGDEAVGGCDEDQGARGSDGVLEGLGENIAAVSEEDTGGGYGVVWIRRGLVG